MLSRLLHIFDNSIGNVHTNSNCSSLIWFGFMHNVPDSSYGPGGTLIFSYIRRLGLRLGSFFVVQILNFIIFYIFFRGGGGVRKMNIFWYLYFLDIFGGHHKIGLYLGVISMHFMVFS